jgi:tetratricopeptide (TPR) repeat protein
MSRPAVIAIRALGILVLIAGFLLASQKVHEYRNNRPAEQLRAEALRVDPTLLKIVSGEFKGLMADYLDLKAAVFKGGARKVTDEDWLAMATLFRQSIELDPFFFHTAYYAQGFMAWRKGMHQKAIDILTIHADHRFWYWEPKFYLGFDYFYYLKDDETGVRYMREAAELDGAPALVPRLAARLMQRGGHTLAAIDFLRSMLENAKDETIKENLVRRLKAHLGVYQLEKARDAYQKREGSLPSSLDELVEKGFMDRIPENTMAETYYYDPQTGEISFDTIGVQ